mmetsp:Transcript_32153/g.99105  ORF Transcript_32153/g.99105 Transcript_32153/m.99105 type:complete len:384 (-) Transcript_32153:88-1239(-)
MPARLRGKALQARLDATREGVEALTLTANGRSLETVVPGGKKNGGRTCPVMCTTLLVVWDGIRIIDDVAALDMFERDVERFTGLECPAQLKRGKDNNYNLKKDAFAVREALRLLRTYEGLYGELVIPKTSTARKDAIIALRALDGLGELGCVPAVVEACAARGPVTLEKLANALQEKVAVLPGGFGAVKPRWRAQIAEFEEEEDDDVGAVAATLNHGGMSEPFAKLVASHAGLSRHKCLQCQEAGLPCTYWCQVSKDGVGRHQCPVKRRLGLYPIQQKCAFGMGCNGNFERCFAKKKKRVVGGQPGGTNPSNVSAGVDRFSRAAVWGDAVAKHGSGFGFHKCAACGKYFVNKKRKSRASHLCEPPGDSSGNCINGQSCKGGCC